MGRLLADYNASKNNRISIKKDNLGNGSIVSSNLITLNKGFFPALGNHDYDDPNRDGTEYLEYFKFLNRINGNTSGSNKYYDLVIKNCHFFVLDSDPVCGGSNHVGNISDPYPAGKGKTGSSSNDEYTQTQKKWFNNRIKQSTSKYKFVFQHHPPYNSGTFHRGYPKLSPHKGWKTHLANAVFSGHEHFYERIRFASQYPSYISVTRTSPNQLKIEYSSNGPLYGTSQLRIHIGNDDWQNVIDASTSLANMFKENSGSGQLVNWSYYYNIPEGADYVNFAFRSNGGAWENNVINYWVYDYIYYLNDSNDFSQSTFIVNGNSGHDLRSFSDQPIPQSLSRVNDKYGFTEVRIYSDGLIYKHYGIGSGESSFSVSDFFGAGNINEQTFLFNFAIIADWGNGGSITSVPSNFFDPPNNYYANKIAEEIKNQNIKYVFGVGDLTYNGILYRLISSGGPQYTIQSIRGEEDKTKESPPDNIDPLLQDPNAVPQGSGSGSGSGSGFNFDLSVNISRDFQLPAYSSGPINEYVRVANVGDQAIWIYRFITFNYYGSLVVGSPTSYVRLLPNEIAYFKSTKLYNTNILDWSQLSESPVNVQPVGLGLILNQDQMILSEGLGLTPLSVNNSLIEVTNCTISTAQGIYYKDSEDEGEINWASDDTPYILVLYKDINKNPYNNNFWNFIEVLDSTDEFGNNHLSLIATNPSNQVNFIPQVDWVDEEGSFFILQTSIYVPPSQTNQSVTYTTFSIDDNVGRFYYDYITCYQGLYINKDIIDNRYLQNGLVPYDPICLNTFKNYA